MSSIVTAVADHVRKLSDAAQKTGAERYRNGTAFAMGVLEVRYEQTLVDLIRAKKEILIMKREQNLPLGRGTWRLQ